MSEKINIDGVRFKVDANLDKLAEDLKKGEGVAKKGGEAMGKAAGKGFDQSLKSDVNKTLDDVKKTAESSSSALTGIFGKVGAAVAGAFALDKVVGFFKDSMKYASDMEEQMGSVSKATKDVREDFEALGKDSLWGKIKLGVGNLLNSIVDGAKAIAVGLSDLFKSPERIGQLYQRERDSIRSLGEEMNKLSVINKRTAEEELKLIDLKDKLSEKARKLGLDYDKLAASGMNYVQILKEMENKAKLNAQADLTTPMLRAIDRANQAQAGVTAIDQQISQLRADPGRARVLGLAPAEYLNQLERSRLRAQRDFDKARAEARRLSEQQDKLGAETPATPAATISGPGRQLVEQRFIETQKRVYEFERNYSDTMQKIALDSRGPRGITKEERARREADAKDDLDSRIRYEKDSLEQMYAEYIEDKHHANKIALDKQLRDEETRQREALNAEFITKEEYEKRIQKIREANARKNAALTAESFAQTMQAAQAVTTGFSGMVRAKDIGSSLSAQGGLLTGLSGFKNFAPALGALGPVGQGVAAIGGVVSALSGLFSKSDEERAQEAREQAQRDDAARKLLELQANYQKSMLALQEAAARTPFENLQRDMRLIDINAQRQQLSGVPQPIIDAQRLSARQSAMQSVLNSEGGKIAADMLFSGVEATPEGLTKFLNERAGQAVAVSLFMQALEALPSDVAATRDFKAPVANLLSYKGKIPDELFNAFYIPYIQAVEKSKQPGEGLATARFFGSQLSPVIGAARGVASEISRDTITAENLLSVIQQSLDTEKEIADSTKKTAANTSRLVDTPNRSSSLIDISRGLTRSLGQVISGPDLTNTALPNGVRAAVLATDIQKSIQERAADGIDRLNDTARKQLELLAIMVTILKNPSNVSPLTVAQLEDLYRRSGIRIAA